MPYPHLAGNLLLIAIAFAAGVFVARRSKRARWFAVGLGALGVTSARFLPTRPDLMLAVAPFSDLIFYANLYPFAAAWAIPSLVAFGTSFPHRFRISAFSAMLLAVCLLPWRDHRAPPAHARETAIDENGVCRQTSVDTCSAAAAVTLLRLHGIDAEESEVARLALTKEGRGTSNLGLYRALRKLTAGRGIRVRVERRTADEAVSLGEPAIVTVGLAPRKGPPASEEEADLERLYSWRPGVLHDVVLLGPDPADPKKLRIAEPDFGLEKWWRSQFEILFRGFAIRLEEKPR